jgi:hypothetical protein
MTASKLALLNSYRIEEGLAPYKDWRSARHQPQLDEYAAKADAKRKAAADAELTVVEPAVEHAKGPAIPKAKKDKVAKADKLPTYKEMATYEKSTVAKPFEFIHSFLDANKDLGRKAAIQELIKAGINYSTARTQYQRWFSKNKA